MLSAALRQQKSVQSVKFKNWSLGKDGTRKRFNNIIGVPWRLVDGKWSDDRQEPAARVDPLPPPPIPFAGARVHRGRITKQDIDAFGTTVGCPDCNAIRSWKRAQAESDPCRARIEERLRTTHQEAERLERRDEVIIEALAEEVQRREKRKEDDSRKSAEASSSQGMQDEPIEPDPDLKRRMALESSSADESSSNSRLPKHVSVQNRNERRGMSKWMSTTTRDENSSAA